MFRNKENKKEGENGHSSIAVILCIINRVLWQQIRPRWRGSRPKNERLFDLITAPPPAVPLWQCSARQISPTPLDMAEISVSIEEARKKHTDLPCGYDEVFVSLVDDDLQCSICQSTLRDPVLTRCGHRFCKDCLGRYISRFVFSSEYERITLNTLRI